MDSDLEKFNVALAQIAVKNHANATKTSMPNSKENHLRYSIKFKKSCPQILRLFDFSPISDGATALIVTSEAQAKKTDNPVYVWQLQLLIT